MGSSLTLGLVPLLFLSLPMRHKVIRAVCDVGLEPVQLTPRTSSCRGTHLFEYPRLHGTGRVAPRGTRAILDIR